MAGDPNEFDHGHSSREEGDSDEERSLTGHRKRSMLGDSTLLSLVEKLLTPAWETAAERLRAAGKDAEPALLAGLHDSRFLQPKRDVDHVVAPSPLSRLLGVVDLRSPFVAERIEALTRHPDDRIRCVVAEWLAKLAQPPCVEPLRRLLNDPSGTVRSAAICSLISSLSAERGAPSFFDAIFDTLSERVRIRDEGVSTCMMLIDRQRAIEALRQRDLLHPNHPEIYSVLETLLEHRVLIEEATLRALAEALRQREGHWTRTRALGTALRMAALAGHAWAEPLIASSLASEDVDQRLLAAEALCAWHGIEDLHHAVFEMRDAVGFDGLSKPQRDVYCLYVWDAEVKTGGIAQFFGNDLGGHARDVQASFDAVGAGAAGRIFQKACAAFGPSGPPEDLTDRQLAMLSLAETQTDWKDLSQEYITDPDHIEVLIAKYAISHRDDFVWSRDAND
ncbi:HEAT repeat protein [Planctomycetes bacterium Pan216]|uniref:HEAT repeat protein n=1 Tax=Kolteria novifilia TaxID=2527975 RepID=A0A518BD37_9BACT|nr:HEAT repeat protein [Planctomycetes bacterium Pan216]